MTQTKQPPENPGRFTVDDQVAKMKPDPENNAGILRFFAVRLAHRLLELDGRTNGVHSAGKLRQRAVAGQLD